MLEATPFGKGEGDGLQRFARSFHAPDERQTQELASLEVVELGDLTIGRTVTRPGFRWSVHIRPVVGGEWCQARHVGIVLAGRFGYTFENGSTLELDPHEVFDIPPGHDGYTLGDEDCVVVEWVGVRATTGFSGGLGNRALVTLLFTDLVGSTERAAQLGDQAWRDLLSQHYESIRRELDHLGGREIDTTGDGMLTTFKSPAAALQGATSIIRSAGALDLQVRAAIHVGEVELVGQGVRGLAVHEAARVMSVAAPDEILVTEPVRAFTEPSGWVFEDRGLHRLKGLDGERRLFALVRPDRGQP